jgi:hypothetical protein
MFLEYLFNQKKKRNSLNKTIFFLLLSNFKFFIFIFSHSIKLIFKKIFTTKKSSKSRKEQQAINKFTVEAKRKKTLKKNIQIE